jgi:ketosteroid isomerase-like protein
MKKALAMFIGTLISLAAFAADKPAAKTPAPGAPAVEAAWQKAVLAGDLDAIVALYADDASAWFPDAAGAHGKDAIRATYKGLLDANKITEATITDVHHKTSGDLSTGWGTFVMTLQPKAGGAPVTMKGRFTEVVEKRGSKWLYVADHASADPIPKAEAK